MVGVAVVLRWSPCEQRKSYTHVDSGRVQMVTLLLFGPEPGCSGNCSGSRPSGGTGLSWQLQWQSSQWWKLSQSSPK